jgi:hypothetical protein
VSGLLQRLAAQALGASSPAAAPRIRSAMSVHAHVPPAQPAGREGPSLEPPTWPRSTATAAPDSAPTDKAAEKCAAPAAALTAQDARPRTDSKSTVEIPQLRAAGPEISPTREREIREIARAAALPERLMPESPPSRIEPLPVAPRPASVRPAPDKDGGASHEPMEVHVHIGRIEVIARPEPMAPKKPRGSASRQTRSLSEYLAGGKRA